MSFGMGPIRIVCPDNPGPEIGVSENEGCMTSRTDSFSDPPPLHTQDGGLFLSVGRNHANGVSGTWVLIWQPF